MIVLGIDPGINDVSWCLIRHKKRSMKILKAGILMNPTNVSMFKEPTTKVYAMAREIQKSELFDLEFDLAGIECTMAFSGGQLVTSGLSFMAGAIAACIMMKGVPAKLYAPNKWKGRTSKEVHQKRLISKLTARQKKDLDSLIEPIKPKLRHNIVDALGIAMHTYKERKEK